MLRILHYAAKDQNDIGEYIVLTEDESKDFAKDNCRPGFKLLSDQRSEEFNSEVLPLDRELGPRR